MTKRFDAAAEGNDAHPEGTVEPAWPSDWLRAALVPCVLAMLTRGPNYGYAITSELAEEGLGDIKGGTLYPLLTRLEKRGLVTTTWRHEGSGPGRKYFELTTAGYLEFETQAENWRSFARLTTSFLSEEYRR